MASAKKKSGRPVTAAVSLAVVAGAAFALFKHLKGRRSQVSGGSAKDAPSTAAGDDSSGAPQEQAEVEGLTRTTKGQETKDREIKGKGQVGGDGEPKASDQEETKYREIEEKEPAAAPVSKASTSGAAPLEAKPTFPLASSANGSVGASMPPALPPAPVSVAEPTDAAASTSASASVKPSEAAAPIPIVPSEAAASTSTSTPAAPSETAASTSASAPVASSEAPPSSGALVPEASPSPGAVLSEASPSSGVAVPGAAPASEALAPEAPSPPGAPVPEAAPSSEPVVPVETPPSSAPPAVDAPTAASGLPAVVVPSAASGLPAVAVPSAASGLPAVNVPTAASGHLGPPAPLSVEPGIVVPRPVNTGVVPSASSRSIYSDAPSSPGGDFHDASSDVAEEDSPGGTPTKGPSRLGAGGSLSAESDKDQKLTNGRQAEGSSDGWADAQHGVAAEAAPAPQVQGEVAAVGEGEAQGGAEADGVDDSAVDAKVDELLKRAEAQKDKLARLVETNAPKH